MRVLISIILIILGVASIPTWVVLYGMIEDWNTLRNFKKAMNKKSEKEDMVP